MFKKCLGKNLRFYRLQKNISQEELARLTGVHRTYISTLEKGASNITLDTLAKLAVGLGIGSLCLLSDHTQMIGYEEDTI